VGQRRIPSAGLAVLRHLKTHNLVVNAARIGRVLLDRLLGPKKYPMVGALEKAIPRVMPAVKSFMSQARTAERSLRG
jgi:hypothetical protein